jgi:hypothetical protein
MDVTIPNEDIVKMSRYLTYTSMLRKKFPLTLESKKPIHVLEKLE